MASRGLAAWAMLGERVSGRARRDEMELRCISIRRFVNSLGVVWRRTEWRLMAAPRSILEEVACSRSKGLAILSK